MWVKIISCFGGFSLLFKRMEQRQLVPESTWVLQVASVSRKERDISFLEKAGALRLSQSFGDLLYVWFGWLVCLGFIN